MGCGRTLTFALLSARSREGGGVVHVRYAGGCGANYCSGKAIGYTYDANGGI